MATNRIGPTPGEGKGPEKTPAQQQHRRIEKVEKVKAIDEVENERARKKFQQYMSDEEEEASMRPPSPFQTEFYQPKESSGIENALVPGPAYSPPPNVTGPLDEGEESDRPFHQLPESGDFWQRSDALPDQPTHDPELNETPQSRSKKFQDEKKAEEKRKQEEALLALPGAPSAKKDAREKALAAEKEKARIAQSRKEGAPWGSSKMGQRPLSREEEGRKPSFPPRDEERNVSPMNLVSGMGKLEKSQEKKQEQKKKSIEPQVSVGPVHSELSRQGHRGKEERGKEVVQVEMQGSTLLPQHVIPMAQAATQTVASYLSPETSLLFFHMVGMIYSMGDKPGVSRTEIVLNSPAFANSKFFGSTILIEKYATAPDALNIRLSGSNEAVATFNQNIPNLYAAFQNGRFNFRIGRIDVEYKVEKPLIRRKERDDTGEGKQKQ